ERTAGNLRAALDAADAASQAKSQFLAAMSHELRTPLNAIIGFSEVIEAGMFGPLGNERYCDYAKSVHDSGRHLLQLINDILDFSKMEASRLELVEEEIDLGTVAAEALRMLETQAGTAAVALELDLPPALPHLLADQR